MQGNINKVTPYYLNHLQNNAEMLTKGGWSRPKQFSHPDEEVNTVRNHVGLIDAHSMGKFRVIGADAFEFMQTLSTNDLNRAEIGSLSIYTCLCNHSGGIVDDVVIYPLSKNELFFITNTLSRQRVSDWLNQMKLELNSDVHILDTTNLDAYLAIQGPKSKALVNEILNGESNLPYFGFKNVEVYGVKTLLARTGYTGEYGYELIYPSEYGFEMWNKISEVGEKYGLKPIGGIAIQKLRSEKSYRSHGNDMTIENNPIEMGLGWTVRFEKEYFIGKESLEEIKKSNNNDLFVGFECEVDEAISVPANKYFDGNRAGKITTSYYSPTLNKVIAMGLISRDFADASHFSLDNSNESNLRKVEIPFYDPKGEKCKG